MMVQVNPGTLVQRCCQSSQYNAHDRLATPALRFVNSDVTTTSESCSPQHEEWLLNNLCPWCSFQRAMERIHPQRTKQIAYTTMERSLPGRGRGNLVVPLQRACAMRLIAGDSFCFCKDCNNLVGRACSTVDTSLAAETKLLRSSLDWADLLFTGSIVHMM